MQPLASAPDGWDALLTVSTPEERWCIFTFRMMTPEEQQEMMAAAQSILKGGGRQEK